MSYTLSIYFQARGETCLVFQFHYRCVMVSSQSTTQDWDVPDSISTTEFFTQDVPDSIVSHEDFEAIVEQLDIYPEEFEIVDRYWVHQPYTYAVILDNIGSDRNVFRYVLVKPQLPSDIHQLKDTIKGVVETKIDSEDIDLVGTMEERRISLRIEILDILRANELLDGFDELLSANNAVEPYVPDVLNELTDKLSGVDEKIIVTTDSSVSVSTADDYSLNKQNTEALVYLVTQDIISSSGIECILSDQNVNSIDTHPETVIDSNMVALDHAEYDAIRVNLSLL